MSTLVSSCSDPLFQGVAEERVCLSFPTTPDPRLQILVAGCGITSTLDYPSLIETREITQPLLASFDRGLNWAPLNFTKPVSVRDIALFRTDADAARLLVGTHR